MSSSSLQSSHQLESCKYLRRAPPSPEAVLPCLLLKRLLPGSRSACAPPPLGCELPGGPLAAAPTATLSPSSGTDADAGLAEGTGARGPGRAAPTALDDVRSVLLSARARPRAPGAGETRTLPTSPPSPFVLAPPPPLAGREGLLSGPTSLHDARACVRHSQM